MIDSYLLEELVTFAKVKTLAQTATQLNVTQPTVTRGMQKLEDDLGVQLFDRQPNKITLTETGEIAAQEAEKLLATEQEFIDKVQNYAKQQIEIIVGAIAPGPLMLMDEFQAESLRIQQQFVPTNAVIELLESNQYSLIITNESIQTDTIESQFLGYEQLFVNLDQFMYLANKQQVSFKELKNLSFVVLNDIGPWKDIIKSNIPDAKFLYQEQQMALKEITKYSSFPYFDTNITRPITKGRNHNDRVRLPIIDEQAKMPFYATYLKQQKPQVEAVVKEISKMWPQSDNKY